MEERVSSLDVIGTVLRLLLRLEELRSSATEQHEILVAQMQVQVRRNPAKNKSLTTENDTMKNTHGGRLSFALNREFKSINTHHNLTTPIHAVPK
eukprot:scaffold2874_cov110-Alexandrium_tamarense.AAC.32